MWDLSFMVIIFLRKECVRFMLEFEIKDFSVVINLVFSLEF